MSLPSTQVTQFCHLNHLLKKVVSDHDDSSLWGVLHKNTIAELWSTWNEFGTNRIISKLVQSPYQFGLFSKLVEHLLRVLSIVTLLKNRHTYGWCVFNLETACHRSIHAGKHQTKYYKPMHCQTPFLFIQFASRHACSTFTSTACWSIPSWTTGILAEKTPLKSCS